MADPRLPPAMDDYMVQAGWGEHHEQWHYEQRYDFWHYRAAQGDPGAGQMVAYGDGKGWGRAAQQEGAAGHGVHFLAMHRAMFELLAESFPQHEAYLAGWPTPPQDPGAADDPVPGGAAFDPAKAEGVVVLETRQADFATEDEYALFLETNIRPTAADPTARTPDQRTGLHNWLHNRWTDPASPVNLGDPRVNIFNARFWRLHGWIDRLWTSYRRAMGLPDDDPAYRAMIDDYRHMMAAPHHFVARRAPDEALREVADAPARPEAMKRFFADAG